MGKTDPDLKTPRRIIWTGLFFFIMKDLEFTNYNPPYYWGFVPFSDFPDLLCNHHVFSDGLGIFSDSIMPTVPDRDTTLKNAGILPALKDMVSHHLLKSIHMSFTFVSCSGVIASR